MWMTWSNFFLWFNTDRALTHTPMLCIVSIASVEAPEAPIYKPTSSFKLLTNMFPSHASKWQKATTENFLVCFLFAVREGLVTASIIPWTNPFKRGSCLSINSINRSGFSSRSRPCFRCMSYITRVSNLTCSAKEQSARQMVTLYYTNTASMETI